MAANPGGARGGGEGGRGAGGRGGFDPNMTPEERRKRMEERMASMTPEERERFEARMKEREAQGGGRGAPGGQPGVGGQPGFGGRGGQAGGRNANANPAQAGRTGPGATATAPAPATIAGTRTTIDSLFAPLQTTETRGRAWLYENKQLKSVQLRLGVSDGTYSEVIDGDLKEGQEVVVNMLTGLEPVVRPGQPAAGNPLMGPQRGGPGGGGGGGNRGGGGRGF
jgi:hypothetical protein